MAKKIDPNELTVEEKLKALYELQQVDSKIDELREQQGELPLEVKNMADLVEGLRNTRLLGIERDIKELETNISAQRVNIENAQAMVAKYKEQQENVRNSREYDNLTKEIEYQELDAQLSQKKISQYNVALEEAKKEKEKTIAAIEEHTVDLNQKRTELNEILSENKELMEVLMTRAAKLENNVDERLLTAFKRIRKNARNGLAVVTVERDACGGCHNKIAAQRQLDIRLHKKIIPCEFCGRILVDDEIASMSKEGKRIQKEEAKIITTK